MSGTGEVAEGVVFTDGRVTLSWLSELTSIAIYASIEDVVKIHGHEGNTVVRFDDSEECNDSDFVWTRLLHINSRLDRIEEGLDVLRDGAVSWVEDVRADLQDDIENLHNDIVSDIEGLEQDLKADIDELRGITLDLENNVDSIYSIIEDDDY